MEPVLHVTLIGGLVATAGGLLAEVNATDTLSQGGLWIGLAGLITAMGSVIQKYFDDKQKDRDHQITRLRIVLKTDQNRRVLVADHKWFGEIVSRIPGLPPPPDLPEGYDGDEPS